VQKRAQGRVVAVRTHVVFGAPEAVVACWATSPVRQRVPPSFVARDPLTQRQSNRRLPRRTHGCSKDLTWVETQVWVFLASDHRVLPHTWLREPLPTSEPTRGLGSQRQWRPVPPAMAAGLTAHVWTTQELLSSRVSAAFLGPLHTIEHLLPRWDAFHPGRGETLLKIERKHLNRRTRITRLVRRTRCFSTMEPRHDLVIGLFINREECRRPL